MMAAARPTDPKNINIYLGTMTGTSMDGMDLVAVTFDEDTALPEILATRFITYPSQLKEKLQQLAINPDATINEMCLLDTKLGQFYADQIDHFIADKLLNPQHISAIGSHGQTIRHSIDNNLPYTLQIGDPNIIAAKTGLTVVADFRRKDVALKGQGAPLAPAFHAHMFRHKTKNRAVINIGGIANITCLPANSSKPIIGFDSGPGNTLMDYICQQHYDKPYDEDGLIAKSGKVNSALLENTIETETYFIKPHPKSTGTDYFSPQWLNDQGFLEIATKDALATLVELTAITISSAIASQDHPFDEIYICGGGAHNSYLTQRLRHHLESDKLFTTEKLGIHPDWIEASAFAWLAWRTLKGQPGNLPSVTNAENFTILGGVYY